MNPSTLLALQASIRHWHQDNVLAEYSNDPNISGPSCNLCVLYFKMGCQGCPIRKATKQTGCWGSPYGTVNIRLDEWQLNEDGEQEHLDFIAAATKERDFLISLLPTPELQEEMKKELGI